LQSQQVSQPQLPQLLQPHDGELHPHEGAVQPHDGAALQVLSHELEAALQSLALALPPLLGAAGAAGAGAAGAAGCAAL
jgi:hypothetical protein